MINIITSKLNHLLEIICAGIKIMTTDKQQFINKNDYLNLDLDNPFYVEREADTELFEYLKDGYLCYVFNSRKMGKTSLETRVRDKLEKLANFKCIRLDFTAGLSIGETTFLEEWYHSLIYKLAEKFELEIGDRDKFNSWWEKRQKQAPIDRFTDFIKELLKIINNKNILIVFDEIDVFLSATPASEIKFFQAEQRIFSQEDKNAFFACLRSYYTEPDPYYKRLVFCLIGVISVSDLISDPKQTPFNVGHGIALNGFIFDQAGVLIKKLQDNNIQNAEQILREILEWTNGQPFLTQKLCDLVIGNHNQILNINNLVEQKIINNWKANDNPKYFTRIEEEVVGRDNQNLGRRLKLYQKILERHENQGIEADSSKEQEQLCLSGLVIKKEGRLKVANKIFERIFDLNWVAKNLDRLRVYPQDLASHWQSTQDPSLLLTGQNLQDAIAWKQRMGIGIIENVDAEFIEASLRSEDLAKVIRPKETEIEFEKVILKMSQRLVGKTTYQENLNIASEILKWTKRDFDLFKIICESIYFESAIPEGAEQKRVREWIEKNIINNWENSPLAEKIGTIRYCLLDSERSFWRLETYQKVLQAESTDTIDSELLTSGLIAKNNDGLQVANQIYASIFNEQWIKDNSPPYTKDFTSWRNDLNSEKLDSHLLEGEALKKALDWIQNKNELSQPELEFIITSLVSEKWQSDEAVNTVKEFLPQLQKKTQTTAHLVRVIQAILEGTKPQIVLLQEVLQWVGEAEFIPTEDEAKWLEGVVQRHLKNCNVQKLSEYLDFNDPSNACWRELKNENAFIIIDEFLEKEKPSQDDIDKVKNYKKRLDNAQVSIYTTESENNFQPLILDILHSKFERTYNMAGQKEFDKVLDKIVADAGGDLEAIIIFDLSEGLPLYHNKGLKERNSKLYTALFGEGDNEGDNIGGEAIEGFDTLDKMQQAFRNFGEKTEFKDSTSIIVNFANGKMMIYFHQAPDIPTAICFMASKEINLGSINRRANQVISTIKQNLDELQCS